MKLRRSKNINN